LFLPSLSQITVGLQYGPYFPETQSGRTASSGTDLLFQLNSGFAGLNIFYVIVLTRIFQETRLRYLWNVSVWEVTSGVQCLIYFVNQYSCLVFH